jgi:hypothetical protein
VHHKCARALLLSFLNAFQPLCREHRVLQQRLGEQRMAALLTVWQQHRQRETREPCLTPLTPSAFLEHLQRLQVVAAPPPTSVHV